MAKADARFKWINVSTAESAVRAPVNLGRHVFLHCIRELSEARGALALRPEHLRCCSCCVSEGNPSTRRAAVARARACC